MTAVNSRARAIATVAELLCGMTDSICFQPNSGSGRMDGLPLSGQPTGLLCCSGRLERGRQDVVRILERHPLWRRDWRGQRFQHRVATAVDIPPHEHRVILVDRVVAVLHVHAAPIAELQGDGDAAAGTQTINVLAAKFPRWYVAGAAVAGQDLAFFEVDVDRVIPTAATV